MQNHYNLVYREEEREMNPYCNSEGVALIPWSPLARGFLAGNRSLMDKEKAKALKQQQEQKQSSTTTTPNTTTTTTTTKDNKDTKETKESSSRQESDSFAHDMYYQEEDFKIVERLVELAKKKGKKPAQIALAWNLNKPGVVAPIIGVTKMSQLEEAVDALTIKLSDDDMKYLEELYKPHRILGHS